MELYTIPQLAQASNLNETTTRRYLSNYKTFFKPKYYGTVKKYPPDSVIILKTIYGYHQEKKSSEEIKILLREAHNELIELKENNSLTTAELISILIDKIDEQQNVITQLKYDVCNMIPDITHRIIKERLPQVIESALEKKVVPVLEYVEKNHKKSFLSRFFGRGI